MRLNCLRSLTPPSSVVLPLNPVKRRGRWVCWGGIALFVMGTSLISLWLLSYDSLADLQSLKPELVAARPLWLLWRMLLLAGLIGGYRYWVTVAAHLLKLFPWQRERALKQRWHVAGLLLITELLVGQRGLYHLCHWLIPAL